jgi:hypothetical protein
MVIVSGVSEGEVGTFSRSGVCAEAATQRQAVRTPGTQIRGRKAVISMEKIQNIAS